MHLLIPFAYCSSEACRLALPALKLPNLGKLLRRLTPEPIDAGDASSLSPPHERALARILGLPVADGRIPWAAWHAQAAKLEPGADGDWAFITPCHWQAGAKHAAMGAAELVDFPALESQILLSAMRPYFEEDGIALHYQQPCRWLARGEAFRGLASASLDRVVGRDVASWLPNTGRVIALHRLQSEMQMLLYNHPVNDAREGRGAPTVNSFWISGTGPHPCPLPQAEGANAPTIITTLRATALAEDWQAWASAWQATDGAECQALLSAQAHDESVQLTLCGERNAQTWVTKSQTIKHRVMNIFARQAPISVLEQL
jgi:hypothetical protein